MDVHELGPWENFIQERPMDNNEQTVVVLEHSGYKRDMIWCMISVIMFILGIVLTHIVYSVMGRVG